MSFSDRVARWFVGVVMTQVDGALAERRAGASMAQTSAVGLAGAAASAAAAVRVLEGAVEDAAEARRPFSGTTTVHRAWARHPGVRGVFAGYHLPACPDCPVGEDETLEEAARGYQIPLSVLLGQLNALL